MRTNVNASSSSKPSATAHPLDALTGGVFSAATSGERLARLREWLATEPSWEQMAEVFKELSHRDRGAAKALKEKMDEIRRQRQQESVAAEWAARAEALLAQTRLNLADALAWQRDAARAGAPLSREPLASLKQALAERVRAVEDLQHQVQVEREASVLLAQRIEILSTKSWREAVAAADALRADVHQWQERVAAMERQPEWASMEPKFAPMMEASRQQLQLVWEAFEAALVQAVAADQDRHAPLPAVPVWADELRAARGEAAPAAAEADPEREARKAQARAELERMLKVLGDELAQGHGKAVPKLAGELRQLLKAHGKLVPEALESQAHALLAQADELEGWQRWRADQLREELIRKAEALTQGPEGQRPGPRKMQETLRELRAQWKLTDQGGVPNHALWKRFDQACNEAHKVVEAWLEQLRQQSEANRAARLALIEEVKAWTEAHQADDDWKAQIRALHAFSERWRTAGHLSEKQFAELQPMWKAAMQTAHTRLEAAQADSVARRKALIEEARALCAQPQWRIEDVKALQQRWQAEAHAVPLERRQEQRLWDAFRKPIDEAFARRSAEREKVASALGAYDRQVMAAVRALEEAVVAGDAGRIRDARQALEAAVRQPPAEALAATAPAATTAAEAEVPASGRRLVPARGDDRPGHARAVPAARDERRDGPGREGRRGAPLPRLSDAVFRAQRQAIENADAALRRLAAQAHGEVLTQLLRAWELRQAEQLPVLQALGGRLTASQRTAWVQALEAAAGEPAAEALLRLEIAADVPTPPEHVPARRALQLQLLTRRHDPSPAETWVEDVARVLRGAYDAASARRLQGVLKILLRR
jgi:ATP-dependent RNA helicase SUPV3L1/SUV3